VVDPPAVEPVGIASALFGMELVCCLPILLVELVPDAVVVVLVSTTASLKIFGTNLYSAAGLLKSVTDCFALEEVCVEFSREQLAYFIHNLLL